MPPRSYTQGERRNQVAALTKELTGLIAKAPKDAALTDNEAFMVYIVDLMNVGLKCLHLACAIAPSTEASVRGYPPKQAIVLGHMVRIRKLFQGFLSHVASREVELAMIFARPMHETAVRMDYLMAAKASSFRNFKLVSYKSEKEILTIVPKKHGDPFLDKIAARMIRKIRNRLRRDGIAVKELMANKRWDIDGLKFRELLRRLGREREYSFTFGNPSHWTHGDWADIKWHHLRREGRRYHPELTFADPDPRVAVSTTVFALIAGATYVKWAKSDRTKALRRIMKGLHEELMRLDVLHERTLMS